MLHGLIIYTSNATERAPGAQELHARKHTFQRAATNVKMSDTMYQDMQTSNSYDKISYYRYLYKKKMWTPLSDCSFP